MKELVKDKGEETEEEGQRRGTESMESPKLSESTRVIGIVKENEK